MYPFEIWNEDTQQIDFDWDLWRYFTIELFSIYMIQFNHQRVNIILHSQSDRLEDVYVGDWNPHHEIGNTHLSSHDCFYNNDNWSVVFETYPMNNHSPNNPKFIFFIEEGHQDPWGEPIRIMSTSSCIHDNMSHRFAYFRGKYWQICTWIPCTSLFYTPLDFEATDVVRMETRLSLFPEYESEKTNWIKEGF